jgi:hypothetical protein
VDEILTRDEIYARCPCEWVLLKDPETDEALHVLRGRVLLHGKDRDQLYGTAADLRPGRFAIFYTGDVAPAGTAVVL